MKKIIQTILILTLASIVMISCKKKEEPEPNNNNSSSIDGTWNMDSLHLASFVNDSLTNAHAEYHAPGAFEISYNNGVWISKHTDTSGTDYDTGSYFITNFNELNEIYKVDSANYDTTKYTFTITNSTNLKLHSENTFVDMGDNIKLTADIYCTKK
jgi:hypothetical protein